MRHTADYWRKKLQLVAHVEGGSFKEIYRSPLILATEQLPSGFAGNRNCCTGIYFLLERGQFSAFHRIASDEQWHFYFGDPLTVFEIEKNGQLKEHTLGKDPQRSEHFHCAIQAGSWFASTVSPGGEYSLVGCTVAPGFDYADFQLANREDLIEQFPQHSSLITSLTR